MVKTNLILQRQPEGAPRADAALDLAAEVEDLPPATAAPAAVPCPYKGLAAFEAEDAGYFFGREELVAELTASLAGTLISYCVWALDHAEFSSTDLPLYELSIVPMLAELSRMMKMFGSTTLARKTGYTV